MDTLKNVTAWILAVLLGLSFLAAGWPKILPSESMIVRFQNWGYSEGFVVLIGVLEFIGGALVLYPRTALYGGSLLIIIMLGAIYTHWSTQIGSPLFAIIYLAMALSLAIVRYRQAYRPRFLMPGTSTK